MCKKWKLTKLAYINLAVGFVVVALAAAVVVLALRLGAGRDTRNDFRKYYDNKVQSYGVQNSNLSKGQIVFVGDSITDLYILDDHYKGLDRACYNRGIGGDTTAGVLKRLQVSVFDLKPSAVVLMIGTNDINGKVPEAEILERYSRIVASIRETLPETKLYCISLIPQNKQLEEYTDIDVDSTTAAILQINPKICRIAEDAGGVYVDLFPLLADEEHFLLPEYSDDGIHLNETGLAVWTAQMLPLLKENEDAIQ